MIHQVAKRAKQQKLSVFQYKPWSERYCDLFYHGAVAILNRLKPGRYLSYVLDTLRRKGLRDEVIERMLPCSKILSEMLYLKPDGIY